MHVISKVKLRDFWAEHPDAEPALNAWWRVAQKAEWRIPNDVRDNLRSADHIDGELFVFNIHGNAYRLVVTLDFEHGNAYIYGVYTHKDYDRLDLKAIAKRLKAERSAAEAAKVKKPGKNEGRAPKKG